MAGPDGLHGGLLTGYPCDPPPPPKLFANCASVVAPLIMGWDTGFTYERGTNEHHD